MNIENWRKKGRKIPAFDNEVFVIDTNTDKEVLLILHGYACSSYDYYKILPELSKHYRVIIPDLICFGSSTKYINKYFSVIEQTDVIIELLKILYVKQMTILAHDYGVSIASELIARKESSLIDFNIKQLFLSNHYVPKKYFEDEDTGEDTNIETCSFSKNTTSMMSSFSVFKKHKKKNLFQVDNLNDEDFKTMWALHVCNEGIEVIDFISNYDFERKIFWDRWMNALKTTSINIKFFWGKNDVSNSLKIVDSLAKSIDNTEVHFEESCGYYPMLEKPLKLTNFLVNS
ncbi:alpha/beta fold hydrolase [Polaribacter porphyrae]|uniref:AB hydrolase-1 domain-containing protein n=1 Tax=Polaribacter porphyrae TaxID=1137780 RepID=A0A2S7WJN5_9FLAO|nr:alpha/beta hydrolase [Polaribacter porphyrae]PQJ77827.1 hypothetical protein BTO18_00895 [Polaribacter porphyrae]